MTRRLMCVLTSAALVLAVGMGCDDEDDSDDGGGSTYTLSGTLTKSGIADGTVAYLKLVASGASGDAAPLYWCVSAAFSGGSATYSIPGVAARAYDGYAFIDVDGNAAGGATSMPDPGDWSAGPQPITIAGNHVEDIPENAWDQM